MVEIPSLNAGPIQNMGNGIVRTIGNYGIIWSSA